MPKHSMYGTPTYVSWRKMKERCTNPRCDKWKYYGGRGIVMCEKWKTFEGFFADMGFRPTSNHSLDRYPNNNGHYEPGNCRWATRNEQLANRSDNVRVTVQGISLTIAQLSKQSGIKWDTIWMRYKAGDTDADLVRQPYAPRSTVKTSQNSAAE